MKKSLNLVILLAVWLGVFALFSFLVPDSFPTASNVETILRQTVIVGFAAVGMTFIIVSGGIDLSVGSLVALVTVVIAQSIQMGMDPALAALCGVVAAMVAGLVNGSLITSLRVVPFIVTLGTMGIFRGLAKGIADEQKVDAPLTPLKELLQTLPKEKAWMLVPPGVWALAGFTALAAWVLRNTAFGRHTVAVGSNEQAARLCGIRIERTKLMVYGFAGLAFGIAGLMQFSRLTVGDPTVAMGLELDVIAAVVIGGASLAGGEGSILGSIVGALLMTTIRVGCNHMGMPNWVQEIVTAGLIVVAVALDRVRARRQG